MSPHIFRIGSVCIIITIICYGCNNGNESLNTTNIKRISVTENGILPSNHIQMADAIQLESNDSCKVGQFTKLQVSKDEYYLLDDKFNKSVLKFSSEGKFIRKYGSVGKGPGEYTRTRWFSINKNGGEIALYDASLRKLFIYDIIDGNFIKSISLDLQAQSFEYLPSGHGFIFYTSFSFFKPLIKSKIRLKTDTSYQAIITDIDGKITHFYIPYPDNYKSQNFLTDWSVYSAYCDSLSFFSQYIDTLYSVDSHGIIKPEFLIDYGNNNQKLSSQYCNDNGPNPVINFQRNSGLRKTSNIFRLLDQYQTKSHIQIVGLHNSNVFRYLIDKSSGNVIDLRQHKDLVYRFGFRTSDCGFFYSLAFASAYEQDESGKLYSKYSKKLQNSIVNSKSDDNPIIIKWQVSEF